MDGMSVEGMRLALETWARDRLARVRPLDGTEGREYRFLSTDWFGLLQKCYWQSEELLEQVANTLLKLPSVAEQPKVRQITKGVPALKLTLAQAVALLRDRVAFPSVLESLVLPLEERNEILSKMPRELVVLRMFADRRNAFTHERPSVADGNEECVIALTSCLALCESKVVAVAIRAERSLAEKTAAADRPRD
jgi:hypothetical protein